MIAVLPQTGQRHRNANGEAAAGSQLQLESVWLMGSPLVYGTYSLTEVDTVKHLEGKLWELRIIGRDGNSRAIYVTTAGRRVLILRVFIKKTQTTPKHELDLATERAKEVE